MDIDAACFPLFVFSRLTSPPNLHDTRGTADDFGLLCRRLLKRQRTSRRPTVSHLQSGKSVHMWTMRSLMTTQMSGFRLKTFSNPTQPSQRN